MKNDTVMHPPADAAPLARNPLKEVAPVSRLPTLPEDITASWISRVLGAEVKSIELTKTLPGTATKLYFDVAYADDAAAAEKPTKLCIKGGFNPQFLAMMPWVAMIYNREVEFFNQIAPTLTYMELPKSRWAGHSPQQGIVIMDDLTAQGCEFGTPVDTWPVSRVMAGVEQLAALHAKTWGVKPTDYPWLTSDYDQAIRTLMQTYSEVVNGADRPPVYQYLRDQPRVTAALEKHFASRNPKFRCLIHGDTHTGNTYLDNGAPRFLDWQMIHIGSSFHDVAYFITSALSVEDRQASEWEIVDHYLSTLNRLGGPSFSSMDEDVRIEYRKSLLAGVGWILCPYSMQTKECVFPMAMRYAHALDHHKVLELMESLPEPTA